MKSRTLDAVLRITSPFPHDLTFETPQRRENRTRAPIRRGQNPHLCNRILFSRKYYCGDAAKANACPLIKVGEG
jgi:hypothetical protein